MNTRELYRLAYRAERISNKVYYSERWHLYQEAKAIDLLTKDSERRVIFLARESFYATRREDKLQHRARLASYWTMPVDIGRAFLCTCTIQRKAWTREQYTEHLQKTRLYRDWWNERKAK